MASIDYPLAFDDMNIKGISYIKNYLERLDIETEFCALFLIEDVDKILNDYGRLCRFNNQIELINIFEVLINNSIFSVLCGNNAREFKIKKDQFNIINQSLSESNLAEINLLIDKSVSTVISDLKIENMQLIEYINKYKVIFKQIILNALKNNCLNNIIVVEEEKGEKLKIA